MPKVGMEPIRREQIRKAAAKVIARLGFDRTTLQDIAKTAHISTGTVNHYYGNKSEVVLDAFVYVSEWFQGATRAALAGATTAEDKLHHLIMIGIFDDRPEAQTGRRVWVWALSESLRSREMARVIAARRDLFQGMLASVLRELDKRRRLSDAELSELAAECDAYLNGLAIHRCTGEMRLDPEAVQRSLLSMTAARIA